MVPAAGLKRIDHAVEVWVVLPQLIARPLSTPLAHDDLLRKGHISANVPVLPGDVILIPESAF